jgi:hypothetical protein
MIYGGNSNGYTMVSRTLDTTEQRLTPSSACKWSKFKTATKPEVVGTLAVYDIVGDSNGYTHASKDVGCY